MYACTHMYPTERMPGKLVLFGGWASEWLNDCYTLDVSGIVGPPYACMGLSPRLGPVTGGTALTISGVYCFNICHPPVDM